MNARAAERDEVPFNGRVLRWARERQQRSIAEAAKRVKINPDRLQAWEDGKGVPTVKQARTLASYYERPFLEFFADEPPDLPQPAAMPDFRLHRGAKEPRDSRDLMAIQAWAEQQRLNALDLYEIIGAAPPPLPALLRGSMAEAPDAAARRAREGLDFPIQAQLQMPASERDNLPKVFRQKMEAAGILVLKESGLSKLQARGMCIAAEPLPVIVFGGEAPSAQMFTLAHELGHVVLKQSAISGPPSAKGPLSHGRNTEEWCNRFAGAFLVPEAALARNRSKPSTPDDHIAEETLRTLAKVFRVSPHAMLIRMVGLGYVAPSFYWDGMRDKLLEEESGFEAGGRSDYYGSRFRSSNGDLYTGLVLEAWTSGRITNHNAGEFLGIKNLGHLEDIRDRFGT